MSDPAPKPVRYWPYVPRLNSRAPRVFFEKYFRLTSFNIRQVVADGSSEFKGEFGLLIQDNRVIRLWAYSSQPPRMNATCECFNRIVPESIQGQFVDFHEGLLFNESTITKGAVCGGLIQLLEFYPSPG